MKVGVFFNWQNHLDWDRYRAKGTEPPIVADATIYDEELHLAGLVEPLGFDSYWAIDHYVTPYGMTGGVMQHLSNIAGRTSRIDLGTMVLVLPWYDPMKVVHQISALDNMLQGRRLTLGVGRGAAIREFDGFRIPMSDARGRYEECLAIMKLAMTQEWFSFDGEFFTIPETTVRPHFRNPERLLADMKSGWASPASLPLAANAGLGMLLTNQKSWADYRKDVGDFNRIRSENGWAATQPTVVVRAACLESSQEAWDAMSTYTLEGQRSSANHYQLDDTERLLNTKGYEQYAQRRKADPTDEQIVEAAARPQAWGTPDEVYDRLRLIQQLTGANEFVLSFRYGTMPVELAERSMRLFAEEVLPRLHKDDAPLDVELSGRAPMAGTLDPGHG
ncbi:MAG: LLM class flavin-dependent oxidoreductase [Pseudonocardia sp.]|uniref:LLM class flavin-dependent oxidoreductase n=1 Tax=unclassified Pseudonocardia TaxID=2619320 RepID=UPI0008686164|nr:MULTISPECIES: LLM class flavin-dependent oxidoreductase [unclassified Pseudonocardia]MBN9112427.1 LLM class flavin-dependent oxidoreductase [Pseudonocardia sp.]ODU27301.1 MAG: luciferase [Pseudonocardia sp. SCN 72-51]ODV08914.1 MAG: luciferase [Pseudonocardia sp. SCN 73-27]